MQNNGSTSGRNWSKSTRRSAPSRITNPADSTNYLSVPIGFAISPPQPAPPNVSNTNAGATGSGAGETVRRRHQVLRGVDRRNFDLSNVNNESRTSNRRVKASSGGRQRSSVASAGRRRTSAFQLGSQGEAPSEGGVTRDSSRQSRDNIDEVWDDENITFPPTRGENIGRAGTGRVYRTWHPGTGDMDYTDEEDSDSSYNSFTDEMAKKALFSGTEDGLDDGLNQTQTGLDDAKTKATSEGQTIQDDKTINTTVYRVYRSAYEGEDLTNGSLKGILKTGTNRKMFQHELSTPLYRWVHIENPSMNFSNFSKIALSCPWLTPQQRKSIESIVKFARSKSEKSLNSIASGSMSSSTNTTKKGSYVEPEYYEETVQHTVYQGFRSRRLQTQSIRWMCIPYFFVRDPNRDGPAEKRRHGTHTKFPVDYTQASSLLPPMDSGYITEGSRFQVAQLWVLVVGDSTIITCARRGLEDLTRTRKTNELSESVIDVLTLPPAGTAETRATGDRAPVLIVSDGGIRTWLLPVDKCVHWPEFSGNFAELGVDLFDGWDLMFKDQSIASKDWSQLIGLAKTKSLRLVLEKSNDAEDSGEDDSEDFSSEEEDLNDLADDPVSPMTKVPPATALSGSSPSGAGPSTATDSGTIGAQLTEELPSLSQLATDESDLSPERWHVFTLLATSPARITVAERSEPHPFLSSNHLEVDQKLLQTDADDVNNYLLTRNKRPGEKESWARCPTASYAQVRAYGKSLSTDPKDDPSGVNTDRLHLIKSTRHMFTFFYPIDFDHVVSQKYWGAVLRILQADQPNWAFFRARVRRIRFVHHVVDNLKEELFSQRQPAYNTTNVPHEFIQVWLMLIMFLVLFATDQAKRSSDYTKRCRTLLMQGKFKVIRRLQTVSLREKEAVLPMGVASLLIGKLCENARGDQDSTDRERLLGGYFGDLQNLTDTVRDDPLSRKYQDEFVSLKTEFEGVMSTIEDQQRVLVALDDAVNELEMKSVINGTENTARSRESIILETTMDNAEMSLFSFVQMERRRAELEAWVRCRLYCSAH
jgi:hypothetical protein